MTRTFVPLPRIAALSAAITLFAAPIASAQSPGAAVAIEAPSNAALLNSAAFARLVQPSADVALVSVVADSPRPSLLDQATAAMVRQAQATAMPKPRQRSWVARHKALTAVFIGLGGFFGFVGLAYAGAFGD